MNRLEEKSSDGMQVATHDEYRSASNNDDRSSGQVSCNRQEHALANSKTLRSAHNPLEDIPRDRLVRQAREFVQENGLAEHTSLFERAILVAQQPSAFELMQELREEELQALRDEVTRKWHLPKAMWVTTILCSIGAAIQGWDQTGSNGANLSFPAEFGIGSDRARDRLLVGLINAMPPLAMVCIGCWLSEPLNNRFGRRGAIFVSALIAFCSVLGSAFTQNWQQLLVCRILLGIGMGIKSSTTVVFAAEGAPASIRGTLVMGWQLWVAFGIFLGFSANIAVVDVGELTWRLQIGSAFIPAVPLLALIYFCPESPRWYMKKRRAADAFTSLLKLRNHPIQAARDLILIHANLEEEKLILRRSGNAFRRFCQLFTVPRNRRANLAASVVMLSQQMCGINIIAFYSSTVFVEAGVSDKTALWASWGFGLVNFLFAIPALRTIDTFGRRSLLLATFPHMAWSLLAAGLCFLIPGTGSGRLAGIALLIFLFAIFYSPGEGPVCYVYAAEVFPLSHREVGMAWAVCVNAAGAFALGLTFPYMLTALTPTGAFGLYCGLNIIAFAFIFLWVPETRQYSLEELDYVFSIPTSTFMKYQITKTIPYWFQKWVLWQRHVKLEPLHLPARLVSKHDAMDTAF